jgi:hypothetical protein
MMEKAAQTIRQYLGPFGCQTKMLDYERLLETAKLAFDVSGTNLIDVAYKVKGLGTRERSARVKEAIRTHWPTPNVLWPANCPVRRSLSKEPT